MLIYICIFIHDWPAHKRLCSILDEDASMQSKRLACCRWLEAQRHTPLHAERATTGLLRTRVSQHH